MSIQVITAKDAAQLVFDGATVCSQGMGGNDVAEELMLELETAFWPPAIPSICAGSTPPVRATATPAA